LAAKLKLKSAKMFKIFFTKLSYLISAIFILTSLSLANEITTKTPLENNAEKKILYLKDIPNNQFTEYAKIQILDKIMANHSEIDIKISENHSFDNLSIIIHKCWQSKPEEKPENKALITIKEYSRSNPNLQKTIFNGWMLSSSPSISPMEHIIYDITLIKCLNKNDD
jgi:hypothetical protein